MFYRLVRIELAQLGKTDFLEFIFHFAEKEDSVLININLLKSIGFREINNKEFMYVEFTEKINELKRMEKLSEKNDSFSYIGKNIYCISWSRRAARALMNLVTANTNQTA
ncbi:MAG: hypothetical protein AAGJ08_01765 [Cyanobacteria bacterium P01_H01_bin.35]